MPAKRKNTQGGSNTKRRAVEEPEQENQKTETLLLGKVHDALMDRAIKKARLVGQHKAAEVLERCPEKMLAEMLPNSLAVKRDLRHRYMTSVVDMIGEMLHEIEKEQEEKIDEIKDKLASSQGIKEERESAIQAAQAELATKKEEAEAAMRELHAVATVYQTTKSRLSDVQAKLDKSEREIRSTSGHKDHLTVAIQDYVKPLVDGTSKPEDTTRLTDSAVATLSKFTTEREMLDTFRSGVAKAPEERSDLELRSISWFEELSASELAKLTQTLQDLEESKAKYSAEVHEVEAAADVACKDQREAANKYKIAREAQNAAVEELKLKEKALESFFPELKKNEQALAQNEAKLEKFRSETHGAFNLLKDKVSEPEQPEPAPEEEEMADEKKDKGSEMEAEDAEPPLSAA